MIKLLSLCRNWIQGAPKIYYFDINNFKIYIAFAFIEVIGAKILSESKSNFFIFGRTLSSNGTLSKLIFLSKIILREVFLSKTLFVILTQKGDHYGNFRVVRSSKRIQDFIDLDYGNPLCFFEMIILKKLKWLFYWKEQY